MQHFSTARQAVSSDANFSSAKINSFSMLFREIPHFYSSTVNVSENWQGSQINSPKSHMK
jgi:hypothetical protein